ncbi:MAG: cell wall hydrolase [Firmicutes bacterium]|nr:cell wall hydrolase [Bacillota bacterium]
MTKYIKPLLFLLLAAVALGWVVTDRNETATAAAAMSYDEKVTLLSRAIHAEAEAEPYIGKVAVGAVLLNRVNHSEFPNTLSGVIYQGGALESVSNGRMTTASGQESVKAAQDALNGWDPTYGALYFWNPYKPVNKWMWTRTITVQYGDHVFAR